MPRVVKTPKQMRTQGKRALSAMQLWCFSYSFHTFGRLLNSCQRILRWKVSNFLVRLAQNFHFAPILAYRYHVHRRVTLTTDRRNQRFHPTTSLEIVPKSSKLGNLADHHQHTLSQDGSTFRGWIADQLSCFRSEPSVVLQCFAHLH